MLDSATNVLIFKLSHRIVDAVLNQRIWLRSASIMGERTAMAFPVTGGVSSIPVAISLWAIVRPPTFPLYLVLVLTGSFAAHLAYQEWIA